MQFARSPQRDERRRRALAEEMAITDPATSPRPPPAPCRGRCAAAGRKLMPPAKARAAAPRRRSGAAQLSRDRAVVFGRTDGDRWTGGGPRVARSVGRADFRCWICAAGIGLAGKFGVVVCVSDAGAGELVVVACLRHSPAQAGRLSGALSLVALGFRRVAIDEHRRDGRNSPTHRRCPGSRLRSDRAVGRNDDLARRQRPDSGGDERPAALGYAPLPAGRGDVFRSDRSMGRRIGDRAFPARRWEHSAPPCRQNSPKCWGTCCCC